MSKQKNSKLTGWTIATLLVIFAISALFLVPGAVNMYKNKMTEEKLRDLQNIYTSAIIVDDIDVGLYEDVDGDGKYEKLSELSGFRVYNAPASKKYSVMKDYKTGQITVYYGKSLSYPDRSKEKDDSSAESISNEDSFTYDESTGRIVVTGLSEAGVGLLQFEDTINIPTSHNGKSVVEIADRAFYNYNITGVVRIPDSIEKIGNNSFSNNGVKGTSNNIPSPHTGSWQVVNEQWQKVN